MSFPVQQSNHSNVDNDNEYNILGDDHSNQPSNVDNFIQLDKPRPSAVNKDEVKLTLEEINLLPKRINTVNSSNNNNNDNTQPSFLSDSYIPHYTQEQFDQMCKQFNADEVRKLGNDLDNEIELSDPHCDNERTFDAIGSITNMDNLYKQQSNVHVMLTEKIKQYPNLCYKWRKIKGDGNCYYRAIFYNYIELLILRNDTSRLRDVIVDMYSKFQEQKLIALIDKYNASKKQSNDNNNNNAVHIIYYQHIILCMLLLYNTLTSSNEPNVVNKVTKAYVYLIKCYNNIQVFDYGCILYLRYIVYKFINANENKCYTHEFPVLLGNLLPENYEAQDGSFLFEKFYEEFLLHLYTDAEKIIIYVTPFILDINLSVLMFEESSKSLQIMKFINNVEESVSVSDNTVTILFRGNHFDLSYNETFVNMYEMYLNQYEYSVEMQKKEKIKERNRQLNEAKRKEMIADAVGEKPRSLCMKINYQQNGNDEAVSNGNNEINSNFNLFQDDKGDAMSNYNDNKEIILDEQYQHKPSLKDHHKDKNNNDNDNDSIINNSFDSTDEILNIDPKNSMPLHSTPNVPVKTNNTNNKNNATPSTSLPKSPHKKLPKRKGLLKARHNNRLRKKGENIKLNDIAQGKFTITVDIKPEKKDIKKEINIIMEKKLTSNEENEQTFNIFAGNKAAAPQKGISAELHKIMNENEPKENYLTLEVNKSTVKKVMTVKNENKHKCNLCKCEMKISNKLVMCNSCLKKEIEDIIKTEMRTYNKKPIEKRPKYFSDYLATKKYNVNVKDLQMSIDDLIKEYNRNETEEKKQLNKKKIIEQCKENVMGI